MQQLLKKHPLIRTIAAARRRSESIIDASQTPSGGRGLLTAGATGEPQAAHHELPD